MTIGQVTEETVNTGLTAPTDVSNIALFVGTATANKDLAQAIGKTTDLVTLFGAGTLATQLSQAQENAGADFFCYAVGVTLEADRTAAITNFFSSGKKASLIFVTDFVADQAALIALQAQADFLKSEDHSVVMVATSAGIAPLTQTWAQYITTQEAFTTGLVANRVMLTPELMPNTLGALAGRLLNTKNSIADTPMKTATGPFSGWTPTDIPVDSDSLPLTMTIITALDAARCSVIQWYTSLDGYYFADGNLLAPVSEDIQKIEEVRAVDKAVRGVKALATQKIGDKKLNNSPKSVAKHESILAKPLRDMAKTTLKGGQEEPGELFPPKKGDVVITWANSTTANISLILRLIDGAKVIKLSFAITKQA